MDLKAIKVKEITGVFYVYSQKGINGEMNNRKNYGLSFCKSGKIAYVQDGVKTVSASNNVIILPKNGNYKIFRRETGYFPVIDFSCDGELCNKITEFPISPDQKLFDLFFELRESFAVKSALKSMSIFYEILSRLFENTTDDTTANIMNYINGNLSDCTLSNKKIADAMNISESYLNKLINKHYGNSVKTVIIKSRMELAVRYLGENRYTIGQISEKCGYSNPYSFSRAFNNYYNMSPSMYKKSAIAL